jgi:hypothetical protein
MKKALPWKQEKPAKKAIGYREASPGKNLSLQGGGLVRAISLISEAKEVGLLTQDSVVDYDSYDTVKELLCV